MLPSPHWALNQTAISTEAVQVNRLTHLLRQVTVKLEKLDRWQLCTSSSAGTEAIRQQEMMKLNRILCRQEHYHLALTAAVLLVTYHITKLHQHVTLIRLTQTAALETHSSSYILQKWHKLQEMISASANMWHGNYKSSSEITVQYCMHVK